MLEENQKKELSCENGLHFSSWNEMTTRRAVAKRRRLVEDECVRLPVADRCLSHRFLVDECIVDAEGVRVFCRGGALGLSVRTTRAFRRGDVVCSYGGKVMQGDAVSIGGGPYFMRICDGVWLDGDPNKHADAHPHAGSFVNDAAGPQRSDDVDNNVVFQTFWVICESKDGRRVRAPSVLLRATRNIGLGEELWASYGDGYWRASDAASAKGNEQRTINALAR